MSSSSYLHMLDYYCSNKTAKDTLIVFYHTAKQHQNTSCQTTVHQISERFQTYFSKIDTDTLDREQKQVLKATSMILERHKTVIHMQDLISDDDHESRVQSPRNTALLESLNSKDINKRTNNRYQDGEQFKTNSYQQSQNNIRSRTNTYLSSQPGFRNSSVLQNQGIKLSQVTSVDGLYLKLQEYYKAHQLDFAYQTAQKIQKMIRQSPTSSVSLEVKNRLREVESEYAEMSSYYKEFDEPGWEFDNTTNNISLYSKTINNGQHVAVLITAELNIPLINFLVMTQEIDLFHKFVPFCGQGDQIKRVDRNLYIGRSTVDVPLLTDRETYFYAKMIDRIETTGSIFFYSKSINSNIEACKKYGITIPEQSKYIKLEYNFFIVECKILSKQKIFIRMASSVDMKLNFLPNFILMMSARKFALQYFMNILKEQKKFSQTEWSLRINEKHSIYGYFQQVINNFLNSKTQ